MTFGRFASLWLALATPLTLATPSIPPELYSPLITQKLLAIAQTSSNPSSYPEWTHLPPYGDQLGKWVFFPTSTWTSGFFPASLYLAAERNSLCPQGQLVSGSDASTALTQGATWAEPLKTLEVNNTVKHDVGFVSFPFWEQQKMHPGDANSASAINAFAAYLAGRFNPIVGCTKSWDSANATEFEVIIDNMINIELFYVSAALTGNDTYRQMAESHANHTMVNHVRPDGSTYHVVVYDSITGAVLRRVTSQGYSDESTWSRGQSWAMYGFTSMFNRTGIQAYLDTARQVSQWYVDHLPTGNIVPPWDFNAPDDGDRPRDTSSAAIASSAMLFLSQMEGRVGNNTGSQYWLNNAITLLHDTVSLGFRRETGWQAILSNGTANNPVQNNNTGLTYGDYYFIKAGNMLLDMGVANCGSGSGPATASMVTNSASALVGYSVWSGFIASVVAGLGLLI